MSIVNTSSSGSFTAAHSGQPISGNPPGEAYAKEISVPELLACQALTQPEKVAVLARDEAMSYSELGERAGHVARYLRTHGVDRNTLVGICLERSANFVVSALGVWRAGGAYVPLDPGYPSERLSWMLNDAQPAVVLTHSSLAEKLPKGKWETLRLDVEWPRIASHPPELVEPNAHPDVNAQDLAYVIYTSGSTGRPKGVEITHSSLSNLTLWHEATFVVTSSDRASQVASPGFDAAVWEMWPALAAGASLYVPDDAVRADAVSLRDWIVSNGITIAFAPTPLAERLIRLEWPRHTALRLLLTGADTLRSYPLSSLPFTLVNNYGPTECTVVATSGVVPVDVRSGVLPSIGRPISNVEVYILDEHLQQLPAGVVGEIFIGGAGVARGYLNAASLTAEKFIRNPFASQSEGILYRTGDLGCYLPDGDIAFCGRIDDQIKIRGYRIEPNEIVAALGKHPAIQASAVVAREDTPGDKQLVAYLVLNSGADLDHNSLREFLSGQLPEYMVPPVFVRLDSMPLNSSGKVNRVALPAPDVLNLLNQDSYIAPRTPVEQRLAEILAPLLGIDKISVEDNFFMLGGHSLLGTQLIARARQVFGVELSLRSLFQSPTIAALAEKIEQLIYDRLEAMSEEEAAEFLKGADR